MARATGRADSTRRLGPPALTRGPHAREAPRRRRRHGAGRQPRSAPDQQRRQAGEARVEPTARGDPRSRLRWPGTRTRRVATALGQQGHHVHHPPVGQRRKALHDRLPGPRNTREGTSPPDRQAPLASSNAPVKEVQPRGPPVGSVETQNKAWGGDVAPGGREDHPPGRPEPGRGHDFLDKRGGPAIPSGVSAMTPHWGGGRRWTPRPSQS